MLFKLFIVLYSFVVLASAKECKPGQNCELKCCSIPEGDLLCRKRCLGLSCEVDAHCDGDCCVNSTCSSCLLKRLSSTSSSATLETTDEVNAAIGIKAINEDRPKETISNSPTKHVETKIDGCSRFNNQCASQCCIDGQCVDSSLCVPVKAARGGRGGGGRGGGGFRTSGGGGGGSGDSNLPAWAWGVIAGGIFLLLLIPCLVSYFCC